MLDLSDYSEELDRCVESILADYGVPGAGIALVVDGRQFAKVYGVRHVGTDSPVTPRTAFNIASTSKAFVSAAAAILVGEGRLSWDDPIQKYVPEFLLYDAWVTAHATIRDLCGNRLGLPREGLAEYGFNDDIPAVETFRRLQHTAPIAGFRDKFTYVNPGHTAVAVAIGRVAGCSFLSFLKQRILGPLDMTDTSGGRQARSDLRDQTGWHCEYRGQTIEIAPQYFDNYLGSGGIWMSTADAMRWLEMQLNGGAYQGRRVVPKQELLETHEPQVIVRKEDRAIWICLPETNFAAYGLGWAVSEWGGRKIVRHSGSDQGVSAQVALAPEVGVGVGVYINKNCAAALEVNYTVLGHALGLAPRNWRALVNDRSLPSTHYSVPRVAEPPDPDARPSFPLEAFVGAYSNPGSGRIEITREDQHLRLNCIEGAIYTSRLYPLGGLNFLPIAVNPAWDATLRVNAAFQADNGKVVALHFPEFGTFTRADGDEAQGSVLSDVRAALG